VAIARCRTYADAEVHAALRHCFDLIGGIATLVKGGIDPEAHRLIQILAPLRQN
jgi:hypothetical protein